MDALAVTLASGGRFVGLAPLGTSLTEDQASQLAHHAHHHGQQPVVATDADLAGQIAAHRDYWLLAQHGLDPQTVAMRPGTDPADVLALHGPAALQELLREQTPLSRALLTERLNHLDGMHAARQAVLVLAASHPATWDAGIEEIASNSRHTRSSAAPRPRHRSAPVGPRPARHRRRTDQRPVRRANPRSRQPGHGHDDPTRSTGTAPPRPHSPDHRPHLSLHRSAAVTGHSVKSGRGSLGSGPEALAGQIRPEARLPDARACDLTLTAACEGVRYRRA